MYESQNGASAPFWFQGSLVCNLPKQVFLLGDMNRLVSSLLYIIARHLGPRRLLRHRIA